MNESFEHQFRLVLGNYGTVQHIIFPLELLHTITIDNSIVFLPETKNGHDAALTLTDKFIKLTGVVSVLTTGMTHNGLDQ
ncbi:hypothetical protein N7493_009141 [Penicillium malachiteum]|uniref:Uncharacterized protein n=1 Tax=Penicillium malachiteum TaxID=1324776 RepID=A0AAD6HFX5_9EURO|nr:hypothetical protein N7493_009141 [Penicillium malachiteum]